VEFFFKGDNQAKERQRELIHPRVLQWQGQGPNPGFKPLCCSLPLSRAAPSSGGQRAEQKEATHLASPGQRPVRSTGGKNNLPPAAEKGIKDSQAQASRV